MTTTKFIAKHFDFDFSALETDCDCKCIMCGSKIKRGIPKNVAIKKTFTDNEYLKFDSDFLCSNCYACMNRLNYSGAGYEGKPGQFELRKYNFLVTEKEFRILKQSEFESVVSNRIETPFVLVFSYGRQKHVSFKSEINFSDDNFIVSTDLGNFTFKRKIFEKVFPIIQKWYSVQPEEKHKKNPKTFFTKEEIRTGLAPFHKLEKYGDKWFLENGQIKSYRGTMFFNFLTAILNVGGK